MNSTGKTETPRRVGILGGTFDPPHFGHLHLAAAALPQLRLAQILWVVTARPPHKRAYAISAAADRVALVEAAIAGQPAYALSRVDLDRPGPHWTADTVACLAEQFPEAALIYLMGGDSLRDLPTWGRPQAFLARCELGVLRRPQAPLDLAALEKILPGLTARVHWIEAPLMAVASSDIRTRMRANLPVDHLVPAAVEQIIRARGLYR